MTSDLIKASITLFVILDIIGLIPVYLSLLSNASKKVMDSYAKKTTLFSSAILLVFLFLGSQILGFFSISIGDFKIAGGIILLIIGIKFVLGLRVISAKERKNQNFAAVPFATPLLVGPGTITAVIIFVNSYGHLITFLAAAINMVIIYIFLKNSKSVYQLLGHQGSEVVTRVMGLLITAIAIGFIRSGWFS